MCVCMYVRMYVCVAYVHTAHKPIHCPILLQSLSRLDRIAADKVHKCTGEVFKVS